ncbi:zinc finger protein 765-like isoform X2 [Ambystoma mexicanum]|uniref:zinc finger protein 765-like isoform X2 n=1 Tax=Ambystoma mexicanum TaxID=8296 RepID=UPI0037E86D5E
MGADEVSSHDASACFSDEEWKLLQDWQKELYKNVMKEIHQALISLGPLIATTVSSLRAKEKEELYPLDKQDSESRQGVNRLLGDRMANTDVSFRIKREVPQRLNNLQDSEGSARNDCVLTGDPTVGPDLLFRINYEEPLHLNHPQDSGGRERDERVSGGFPVLNNDVSLRKEEPVSVSIDHRGTEPVARSNNHNSGYEVVSFQIKDEEEVYFIEDKDTRRIPATEASLGNESVNRKRKFGDSFKSSEKTSPCAFPGKINAADEQNSNMQANSRRDMWPECNWNPREEETAECESSFSNTVFLNLHQRIPEIGGSEKYNEYTSNMGTLQISKDLPSTPQNQRTFTEADKNFNSKGELSRDIGNNSNMRPYACSECDKSFIQKRYLTTHYRIHSGEKPYLCIFCHKRFHRKDNLDKHIRIHTGERPYTCTKCEKTFIQRSHLTEHQRKHT